MTIYISDNRGNQKNTSYPIKKVIGSADDLKAAVEYDNVPCEFSDGVNNKGTLVKSYRAQKCFVSSDCIVMDCDNTSTDPTTDLPPEMWKTPEDVESAFPGTEFYIVYSRHHMKAKKGQAPRPKFHVYFPLGETYRDHKAVVRLMEETQATFGAFDPNALKINQFMFGVEDAVVEYHWGFMNLDDFIKAEISIKKDERIFNSLPKVIGVGERSNVLNHFAGRVLTRFGDSEKAREAFEQAAGRCEEALDDTELESIWRSALGFYKNTVLNTPGYEPPEEFESDFDDELDGEFTGREHTTSGFTTNTLKKILHNMHITVRNNQISGKAEIEGMPEKYSKGNAFNVLPVLIRDFMVAHKMKCSRQVVDDTLIAVMDENRYNPVDEMIKSVTYTGTAVVQA